MNAIIDFFTSCIDIIVSLLQLLWSFITGVVWLISNLPQIVSGVTAGFAYTPTFLMPFLAGSVALMVAYAIIRML